MIESVKRLRLFLEGIECPVISASVTCNVGGGGATASITIIATPEMLNISPRTCVHLFFLEDIAVSLESDYKEGLDLAGDKRYRILFTGEIHGISYSKNASGGINGVLECKDHYENYNRAFVYFSETGDITANAGVASNVRYIYAGASVQYNYIKFNATENIERIFRDPKPLTIGYENTTGLQASIVHTIERFSGFINPDGVMEIAGYSTFQTVQQLRLKILQQLGIYSKDTFASKLMSNTFLINMLQNVFKIEGGLLTVSQIIDEVLNVIYYTRVSNPCSYPSTVGSLSSNSDSVKIEVVSYLESISNSEIDNTLTKEKDAAAYPITWFGLTSDSYKRVLGSKDIRVWLKEVNKPITTSNPQSHIALISLISKLALVSSSKDQALILGDLSELLQVIYSRPVNYSKILEIFKSVNGSVYKRLYESVGASTTPEPTELVGSKMLKNIMFLPDLFWSVAPTCNVIFPNMYETFNVNSAVSDITTRMTLQANNEFISQNPNQSVASTFYFSPSLIPVNNLLDSNTAESDEIKEFIATVDRGKKFSGYLLDHELFTGIVPEFSTKDIFKFLINNPQADNETEFLARTTDYLYVQSRLSKTSISINGIFNPYIAVGFPCVVLDRYSTTATGSDLLGSVSNHYIGLVSLVTHTIDQGNATTSYSISYARRHKDASIQLGGTFIAPSSEAVGQTQTEDPLESRIEPLWLDRAYRSDKIGNEVYKELLGVNSVVDDPSLEKPYFKFEDGTAYASQESAIENLEKNILSSIINSDSSLGKFTRSYIYREIATLDFMLGQNAFHSFDINLETSKQAFNLCSQGLTPPISDTPHTGDAPISPAVMVEEVRRELVRKYVESIHNRGIPI